MFERIYRFYASKTPRERAMLMALAWVAVCVWWWWLSGKQADLSARAEMLESKIAAAEMMISQKPAAEKKLAEARSQLDEKKTVSDLRVELEGILKAGKFGSYSLSFAPDQAAGKMTVRTANVGVQKTDMDSLIAFEKSVLAKAPYVSVKSAEFTSDGKGVMSARYEITSFEFK